MKQLIKQIMTRSHLAKLAVVLLIALPLLIGFNSLFVLGESNFALLMMINAIGLLVALFSLWGVFMSLVGVFFFSEKLRPIAFITLVVTALNLFFFFFFLKMASEVRHENFVKCAERSAPLVHAIRQYEKDNGNPPATLEALVPQYLSEVPETGLVAYPEYEYHTDNRVKENYAGNSWMLYISTPEALIDFSSFIFLPNQNYAEAGYREAIEPIGDWVYFHD